MVFYGWTGKSELDQPWWLPDVDADPQCVPWGNQPKPGFPSPIIQTDTPTPTTGGVYPLDSPEISVNGCTGPSNCFSLDFKYKMALVMVVYVLLNHLFVKIVLQGWVSDRLRNRQQRLRACQSA